LFFLIAECAERMMTNVSVVTGLWWSLEISFQVGFCGCLALIGQSENVSHKVLYEWQGPEVGASFYTRELAQLQHVLTMVILSFRLSQPGTVWRPGEIETSGFRHMIA